MLEGFRFISIDSSGTRPGYPICQVLIIPALANKKPVRKLSYKDQRELDALPQKLEDLEKEINQEFEKEKLENKKDKSYSIAIIIILLILIIILVGYMFSIKKMQIQNEEDE